jgi:hypothetical protein
MSDLTLEKHFHFNEGDLNANRNGRLSDRQLKRLGVQAASHKKSALGFGIVLLGIASIGVIAGVVGLLNMKGMVERIAAGALFGLLWPYIWGGLGIGMIKSAIKQPNFELQTAQGPINIVKDESYDSTNQTYSVFHELHIGGCQFDVEGDLADLMMQGDEYAVYYLKDREEIVSAELISKAG